MSNWQCGDCGCKWSNKITYCPHTFDDYLGVRGVDTIEAAMGLHLAPIYRKFNLAIERVNPPFVVTTFDWYGNKAITITPSKYGVGYDFSIPAA